MAGLKTNKSFKKRLKLTKDGKVLRRIAGIDHFNAKESRNKQLNKKGWGNFNIKKREVNRFLPYK